MQAQSLQSGRSGLNERYAAGQEHIDLCKLAYNLTIFVEDNISESLGFEALDLYQRN
jgi:hypothetical protein